MSKNDRVKLRATFGWVTQERGGAQSTRPGVRPRRAHARFLQSWSRSSSTMSHVIPSRLFQILKSSRWNCNVCGLCRKLTVLNYVRLLGGNPQNSSRSLSRSCGFSTMSHVIPLRLFQTLKSSRWNCNVCGLRRKMTVLNYVRLLSGCPRKGGRIDDAAGRATLPGTRHCRAYDAAGLHAARPRDSKIRSPSPRPRCPRPRPSRRMSRNPRRSRGSHPRSGSGPPGSRGSRRSRRAGTGPRTPGS